MLEAMLIQILMGLGLSRDQAKIYRALLELGEATVQEIAKKSAIKRTSAYYLLEQLKEAAVIFETKKRKKTFYVAERPEELLKKFSNKIERFAKHLQDFKALENANLKKPRIYLLEGAEGFKKVWQMLFQSGVKEYLIITDPREMLTFVRKGYITQKIIREKLERGIKSRQLIAFSEYAKEIVIKDKKENRISKVIPHIYKIPFTTIVFGDAVALISPHQENMILVIESSDYAKTQRAVFEALWEKL